MHYYFINIYIYHKRKGNENHQLGTGFFVHQRIASAVKKVEFFSDRLSYIVLRGRWCNIIVMFSSQQLGMRVYTRRVMIMVLE
jgi:hypothetical protein